MKNILIVALTIVSANAYECTSKSSAGVDFTTMSNTFKDSGDTKSMWIESKKIIKGKVIETSKQKVEIQPNKNLRVAQGAIYDKNGNAKKLYNNGDYARFEEVIPDSMGEWMWHIITNWEHTLENPATNKKQIDNYCSIFGYNDLSKSVPIEKVEIQPSVVTPE